MEMEFLLNPRRQMVFDHTMIVEPIGAKVDDISLQT